MDDDVAFWPAVRQAAAIRQGVLSARELLDEYAARIARWNPAINAVVTLDLERAARDADAIDRRLARREDVGPLAGLPMTIKDAIAVGGMRSTSGAVELRDHVPDADAPAVAALRAAGAVIMGKSNLPAWCSGDTETNNELFGCTSNPWDLGHSVGGSSGGSAAAVAAGLSSAELGTDIGGSVRIPSHCCGVYGLKPSYGVVSQLGYLSHLGAGSVGADMNVFGPITRSPDDLGLLLDVLAGPDPDDALAWRVDLPAPRRAGLDEYRIGTWLDDAECPVAHEYLGVLGRAVDAVRDAGARIDDARPAVTFAEQRDLWMTLAGAATSPALPESISGLAAGSHLQWIRNQERKAELRGRWLDWFVDHDALLCPVHFSAAPPHHLDGDPMDRTIDVDGVPRRLMTEVPLWAGIINVVGLPSCVVPIGRTPGGLPVGLQIVTGHLRDREAVDLARHFARVLGGSEVPPLVD